MRFWSAFFLRPFAQNKRGAGASIVEILVSFAILSIGLVIVARYQNMILENRSDAEFLRSSSLVRSMIYRSVNCSVVYPCKPDEWRELRDYEGRVIVSKDGSTHYGQWYVRAQCRNNGTFDVKMASIIDGRFRTDPKTAKVYDWDHPQNLIANSAQLCGNQLGSAYRSFIRVQGELCEKSEGTCTLKTPDAELKMCCEDGRDRPKPKCPASTEEYASYWDRDGDWGLDGAWVVLCI